MKGYKGFHKGMICRGKQYTENTVFEEPEASICKNGMHFCKNPLDVLDYYDFMDYNGEFHEFAEVEALDEVKTDDYQKYCTKKLKIGAKLSLDGFIQTCAKTAEDLNSSVDNAKLSSSADSIQVGVTGCEPEVVTGVYFKIAATGEGSKVVATGERSEVVATGDYSNVAIMGDNSKIVSTGEGSKVVATGKFSKVASTGLNSKVASTGLNSAVASTGDYSAVASTGNYSKVASTGRHSKVASTGECCIICCAGIDSHAKAKKGSWITLAEWEWNEEKENYIPICVKTEYVDGERIKADVFYVLKDGEFQEVKP